MSKHINSSNRYPWPMISQLIEAIAEKHGLNNDNVLVGAGSTQIIDAVVQLAALQKGSFILARPTFSRLAGAAEKAGLQKIEVSLNANKQHDLAAMLHAVRQDTRLIYICNPNNPTGTICEHGALTAFIKEASKHSLVMVDEAYIDYTNEQSVSGLVADNKSLIVVKTFSKIYGLAGARIGYALAHANTIERLQELQCGANIGISTASLAGAMAALKDDDHVKKTAIKNSECRNYTINELERHKINCIPSNTNFIYFSLANYNKDFFGKLKNANIKGTEIFEEDGKWSRITVGTDSEMSRFIKVVTE